MYCVTLYSNVTATYAAGECGLPVVGQAPLEPTSTSVDPSAFIDGGLACVEGTSVFDCRASYSDGTTRPIRFTDMADPVAKKIDSDPHIDGAGEVFCVTLYDDATATVANSAENC